LRPTNVVVDSTIKKNIMKMYGKGLTKDEQTEKKKTNQDLFKMILKEYNTADKYNEMLTKISTAIPKALLMPDQFGLLPEGKWAELHKAMKKAIREVKEECHRIEDVSRRNESGTYHTPYEEETNESDKLSKKKHWMKVLEDHPNLFIKVTASLDTLESKNKKIGTAKKAAKRTADNDLVIRTTMSTLPFKMTSSPKSTEMAERIPDQRRHSQRQCSIIV
jgi:hypothetical protein